MSKVYILLPVHNRRELTKRFIECLLQQTCKDYHLVLLDDGSTDGTSAMVQERVPALTVLRGTGDWWWGGALHRGYRWLNEQRVPAESVILMMNDDTRFAADFLAKGVSFLEQHRRTLLMAQCYHESTNEILDPGVHVDWKKLTFRSTDSAADINCLATRGLFLRWSDFHEIGGFRPRLIPHYLSDYEFTIRGRRKGMRLCTNPSVMLWMNSDTTGLQTINTSTVSDYLISFFSLRSVYHLRAWTFFILLACPLPWIPLNLLRVYFNPCKYFCKLVEGLFSARDKPAV